MVTIHSNTSKIRNELSPELRVMLLCARLNASDKDKDTVEKLIAGEMNWTVFCDLVLHHRVYPLVYRYLRTLAHSAVPNEVISTLRQWNHDNRCKTLQMVTELVRILRAFEQKRVKAIVVKGFPLAQQLYGDITLRTSRDLDILVSPVDIAEARRIIEKHGYIWNHPLARTTCTLFEKWMGANKHIEYYHPGLGIYIELHWRLDCQVMDFSPNLIRNNRVSIQMFGQEINILGNEELLLYLVIHGAVHAWFRAKWLLDVDLMIKKGEFSWENLYLLADNMGVKSVLNQTILLLQELLETPFPKTVIELAAKDMKSSRMAIAGLRFITDNHRDIPKSMKEKARLMYRQKAYEFSLLTGWRRQASCIYRCFLPSVEDFALISLSERLYFFYYIISPLTWFYRRIRNVLLNVAQGCSSKTQ